MRINTISSLKISNALTESQRAISRALERLSTGSRINHPQDDYAGFSQSVKLDAKVRGLRQAALNINSGLGITQTTESALSTQTDILQKMRELAVQAANGTLSSSDRENLQTQLLSLRDEFDRITKTTQFNGMNLLNASNSQVDLGLEEAGSSIELADTSLSKIFSERVGIGSFKLNSTFNDAFSSATRTIESADLDNDGDIDYVQHSVAGGNAVFLNDGEGNFRQSATVSNGTSVQNIKLVDVNADGIIDLVLGAPGAAEVNLGNGDGTFQSVIESTGFTGNQMDSFDFGDFNGDGNLDIAARGPGLNYVSIGFGDGDGSFSAVATVSSGVTGSLSGDLKVADFNNDGILDIVTGNYGDQSISVLIGDGSGDFTIDYYSISNDTYAIGITDANEDGYIDLLVMGAGADDLRLMLNNGDGTFGSEVHIADIGPSGSGVYRIKAFDFNHDGHEDFAFDDDNGITIFENDGSGNYTQVSNIPLGDVRGYDVQDYNGDGILDILSPDGVVGMAYYLGNSTSQSGVSRLNLSSVQKAQDTIGLLDSALSNLSELRSKNGIQQSILERQQSYALLQADNLAEARDLIISADLATETADLVRAQILQQAQVAALGQANLNLQIVLQLFNF